MRRGMVGRLEGQGEVKREGLLEVRVRFKTRREGWSRCVRGGRWEVGGGETKEWV